MPCEVAGWVSGLSHPRRPSRAGRRGRRAGVRVCPFEGKRAQAPCAATYSPQAPHARTQASTQASTQANTGAPSPDEAMYERNVRLGRRKCSSATTRTTAVARSSCRLTKGRSAQRSRPDLGWTLPRRRRRRRRWIKRER
jgi:hypothetical protein